MGEDGDGRRGRADGDRRRREDQRATGDAARGWAYGRLFPYGRGAALVSYRSSPKKRITESTEQKREHRDRFSLWTSLCSLSSSVFSVIRFYRAPRNSDRKLRRTPLERQGAGLDVLSDEGDGGFQRSAGAEEIGRAARFQRRLIAVRNGASEEQQDVFSMLLAQQRGNAGDDGVVGAGQDGEADAVDVLLNGDRKSTRLN